MDKLKMSMSLGTPQGKGRTHDIAKKTVPTPGIVYGRKSRSRLLVEASQKGLIVESTTNGSPMKVKPVALPQRQQSAMSYTSSTSLSARNKRQAGSSKGSSTFAAATRAFYLSKPAEEIEKEAMLGATGIRNLGNTCYLAAVTSALLTLKEFTDGIAKVLNFFPEEIRKVEFPFLSSYMDISNSNESKKCIDPAKLRRTMARFCDTFSSFLPQDAHEFFVHFQMGVLDDLDRALKYQSQTRALTEGDKPPQAVVFDNFHLEVSHELRCQECHYTRVNTEESTCISLDLNVHDEKTGKTFSEGPSHMQRYLFGIDKSSQMSVMQLLKEYLRTKEVDLVCEKCGGKRASVTSKISRVPRVLAIHLKRFRVNVEKNRIEKSNAKVRVDKLVDLTQLLDENAAMSDCVALPKKESASTPNRSPEKAAGPVGSSSRQATTSTPFADGIRPRTEATTAMPGPSDASKKRKRVEDMTEEEQFELAIQQSLGEDAHSGHGEELLGGYGADVEVIDAAQREAAERTKTEMLSKGTQGVELEAAMKDAQISDPPQKDFYLASVVRHIGSQLHDGHFVADVLRKTTLDDGMTMGSSQGIGKSPFQEAQRGGAEKKKFISKWLTVNDATISPSSDPSISGSRSTSEGYLLFYVCRGFELL